MYRMFKNTWEEKTKMGLQASAAQCRTVAAAWSAGGLGECVMGSIGISLWILGEFETDFWR